MNRDPLITEIDSFMRELGAIRQMIEEGDRESLREKMRTSTNRRSLFDKPKMG